MTKRFLAALTFNITMALQAAPAWAAKSLIVTLYPHDELGDISDNKIRQDFVQPWLNEMRELSNHSIEVIFKRNIAGITDIRYREMSPEDTYRTFSNATPPQFSGQKSVLLARNTFGLNREGTDTLGLAKLGYPDGIASLATYTALAHELGHMMNATHKAAELRYNPWRCETYVFPLRNSLRSNCYRYSDENRASISSYLNETLGQ
ncbi:hypothetical protein BGP84_18940 [Pseudomonas putida]|uniref:Uncharacterized protein n=1 Tax=Pseudomonas putida TaxID=303 RepID=A0A2S3WU68_PSEPU|nr:hypothetical protein [Pseudomonas putida]POG04972.1 hypothetical protein BGP84_18940 [Pseudomonas putida]POG07707.1 hypothetical protein BGP85_12985 [Pseudomonas putida]